MGYCMHQRDAAFTIKPENAEKALAAIKSLATETAQMGGGRFGGDNPVRWFSWVTTEDFVNADTLTDALWAWRWQAETDEEGGIESIMFEGEKLGDDFVLFKAIAPYVEGGSYIEMQGEDGAIWRYAFDNGKVTEKNAVIGWE